MNQIGQEGDAAGCDEDDGLGAGGGRQNDEADRDGANAVAGANDRAVDEAVSVSVSRTLVRVDMGVRIVVAICDRRRPAV